MPEPTTAERVEHAAPILDRYNEQLHRDGEINSVALELELREAWCVGYQALKTIMIALMQYPKYEHLAAYYGEFSNPAMMSESEGAFYTLEPHEMCVISDFEQPLAEVYGASTWHHDHTLKSKREEYWQHVVAEHVASSGVTLGK